VLTGRRRSARRRVRGLRSAELRLLTRLRVRVLLARRAELRGLTRRTRLSVRLRLSLLRSAELRVLTRLLPELPRRARLAVGLLPGLALRRAELRLLLARLTVRLLTRLALRRAEGGRLAELRRLSELLLSLLRSAVLRLLTRLRPELRLLRSAELRVLLLLRCPRLGAGTPGEVRLVLLRGLLRRGARLAELGNGPLRRLGLHGRRRGGPLRRRLGARVLLAQRRNRPLGRLGLRARPARRLVGLGGTGIGRRVGHGSARYPTNGRQVTPAPYLSPDCGVRSPRVHLAWTTTEEAILSLHVCDFRSHSGHR
jgi:hypothetical protein